MNQVPGTLATQHPMLKNGPFLWVSMVIRLYSEGPKLSLLFKTNPKARFKEAWGLGL